MRLQKLKSFLASIFFIAILAAIAYFLNRPSLGSPSPPVHTDERGDTEVHNQQRRVNNSTSRVIDQTHSSIGFASRQKLIQHYQKHGREFGKINLEEYLNISQTLRDKPVSYDVLEYIRPDGIVSRFEKSTGTFVACNPNRIIRTCFKPNDGLAYFERQKFKDH